MQTSELLGSIDLQSWPDALVDQLLGERAASMLERSLHPSRSLLSDDVSTVKVNKTLERDFT